ncbi:bifunctional aspartate kinase/homoserine dehydrogenase I, partial [Aquicoccus sp. SCR17]|nr:bifunctional aspartate kinase/homoserine dehydrogenase I [Carideicomes alvinocaridis]
EELKSIEKILSGVFLTGDYSLRTKDELLSFGELISGKTVAALLNEGGLKAQLIDSRSLIKTDDTYSNAEVDQSLSKENVIRCFHDLDSDTIPVVTGFIASNKEGVTTTLGRNGTNYSAALLANFLDASELINYTHVDGIFTANPDLVSDAKLIDVISYDEANELANFGATILHAKTIIPLIEKNIPLRICNTFNDDNEGTLIGPKTQNGGIKSLSVLDNMALINLEGRGLLGKVGIMALINLEGRGLLGKVG